MNECPRCKNEEIRKDGIIKNKQRFRCKECNYRFTVVNIGKPVNRKREAILLYLAGVDLRTIGELVGTSHVAVYNWIKEIREPLKIVKGGKVKSLANFEAFEKYLLTNKQDLKAVLLIGFKDTGADILFDKQDV